MAIVPINVGNAANDGTGDDLREAFIKVNDNFTYLSSTPSGVVNLGAGAGIYANQTGGTINLKSLVPGNPYITITELENTIVFTGQPGTFTISDGSNSMIAGGGIPMAIIGLDATTVSINDNTKTVSISSSVSADLSPQLGAGLDGNNFSITNVNNITATSILGTTVTATSFVGDVKGSLFADDSTIMVDGITGNIYAIDINATTADITTVTATSISGTTVTATSISGTTVTATSILGTTVTATNLVPTNINGVSYANRLGRYIEGFNFGSFTDNPSSILDFVILSVGVDYGTFVAPNNIMTDFGFI